MNILLTGTPHVGKSTVISRFREQYSGMLSGIITQEVLNQEERVGFEAISMNGEKRLLAHTTLIQSPAVVGRYKVDTRVIDSFVVPELKREAYNEDVVTIIDEIGRIQASSPLFLSTVAEVFAGDSSVLGSLDAEDEPWAYSFKTSAGTILVEVTERNRGVLPALLGESYGSRKMIHRLPEPRRKAALSILADELARGRVIGIHKLFRNALAYISQDRISLLHESGTVKKYHVQGNSENHAVTRDGDTFTCDCDLFNGRNSYKGQQGECSHIQAIRIAYPEQRRGIIGSPPTRG